MHQSTALIGQVQFRQGRRASDPSFDVRPAQPADVKEQLLPFTVRLATSAKDVYSAVKVRHSAYARHVPALAERLLLPEETDFDDGVVVLLAESKVDGSPLGTMRIQTNRFKPLSLEQSVELPAWIEDRSLAEATRLGVAQGRVGTFVKTALFKAYYQFCIESRIDYMVITARTPLDQQYEQLMFTDVFPDGGFMPMRHVGDLPHRVMCLDVPGAAQAWQAAGHPLFGFMTQTRHPDVDVRISRPASQPVAGFPLSRRTALPSHLTLV